MLVKKIEQTDRYTFSIEWSDGLLSHYRLSHVQRNCPCISCREERALHGKKEGLRDEVRALRIQSVGRYALKIAFTSGCSKGIYPYSLLRRISK